MNENGIVNEKKPELIVFAGPNGSGKSTITDVLRPPFATYINQDEIKKFLHCTDMEALEISLKQKNEQLKKRNDFCFETVLSSHYNLDFIKKAKDAGYFVRCYFIITVDPLINVTRVKLRVESGGHDVPTDKIISRYDKSLDNIQKVIPLCDVCHIYDNSYTAEEEKPYRIFKKRKEQCFYHENSDWLLEDIQALTGVEVMEQKDLNMY